MSGNMFRFIFIIYLFTNILLAGEFVVYSEFGKYNKAYVDENIIKGNNKESIASNMYTLGGYYTGNFDEYDTIWGIGIVQSKIDYNSIKVLDKLIEQPEVIITNPYIFIGLDKKYWSFEIGVSYYFNIEKFKARVYHTSDTETEVVDDAGWGLNRFKSHTYANLKFRLLRDDKFHIELLLSRDKFSPVDSLLRVNFVLPLKTITLNTDISLFMPANYFTESDVILKSNQRFTFGLDYKISNFNIGANFGVLIKNAVGGDSYIKIINRLSAGLNISMGF